jgi:hypothetical protein
VYYYLIIFGSPTVYLLAFGCVVLIVGVAVAGLVREGGPRNRSILALAAGCGVLVVGLSMYHSWVNDFQPQGRYLFAMFPVLGMLLMKSSKHVGQRVVAVLIAAAFVLSTYSFVFTGLKNIPKRWENARTPDHPVFHLEREWRKSREAPSDKR